MKRSFSLLLVGCLLAAGCRNPFDRTKDASGGGALGAFGGTGTFVIFSDELKTGGGAFEYPGGENQTLVFNDTSTPLSHRSIRYDWTGQDVSSPTGPQHIFAGFDLMHTALFSEYATTPGRDLRQAGYTKLTFYVRGTLSTNTLIKIEGPDDGNSATPAPCLSLSTSGTLDALNGPCGRTAAISAGWQSFTLTFANASLNPVKDFFKATYIFNPLFVGSTQAGQGGTVYFDQIEYAP